MRIQNALQSAPRIRRRRRCQRTIERDVSANSGLDCAAREAEEFVEFLGFMWVCIQSVCVCG
jgi:hypothetical protein